MVKILKTFKGTSDFKTMKAPRNILNEKLDWTFNGLNIFSKIYNKNNKILNTSISLAKGYSQVTISRETMLYTLNILNISTYQMNFDNYPRFANDELFWSTLFSNYEYLKIPGTLPTKCINSKNALNSFTRHTKWSYFRNLTSCSSGYRRHSICIIGLEYINQLEFLPHFFANKLMDYFDAGAVDCWGERLFNRTFFPENYNKIDLSLYLSRPQVLL